MFRVVSDQMVRIVFVFPQTEADSAHAVCNEISKFVISFTSSEDFIMAGVMEYKRQLLVCLGVHYCRNY